MARGHWPSIVAVGGVGCLGRVTAVGHRSGRGAGAVDILVGLGAYCVGGGASLSLEED